MLKTQQICVTRPQCVNDERYVYEHKKSGNSHVQLRRSGQNAAGQPTAVSGPIALSRHYAKNRIQSLRVDSSAGGTRAVGSSSYRVRDCAARY